MIRVRPTEPMPFTAMTFSRSLDQRHPYLRSGSVCIETATRADAEEMRRQRFAERVVIASCVLSACALLAFYLLGWLP